MTVQMRQIPASTKGSLDRRSRHLEAIGAHHCDLAVAPRRPVGRVLRRQGLGRIDGRRRPRPLHRRVAASERGQAAVVGALRNAGQGGEPRDRQLGCRSQGLEVGEGTRSTYSEPFCQIRSCTVISWASTASTSCSRVSTGTGSLLLLKIDS